MAEIVVPLEWMRYDQLPPVCMRTGEPTRSRYQREVIGDVPPWTLLLLPLGLIPAFIVMYAVGTRVRIRLPLTSDAHTQRLLCLWAPWVVLFIGLAGLIAAAPDGAAAGIGLVAVLLAALVTGLFTALPQRLGISLAKGQVTFGRAHPDFVAAVATALEQPLQSPYQGWGVAPFAPVPMTAPPGWNPDPSGQFQLRYWDGQRWTEHVSTHGQQGISPIPF